MRLRLAAAPRPTTRPRLAGPHWALRLRVLAMVVGTLLFAAPSALADGRVQFLAERLMFPPAPGHADDFRVRTNAALALGATNSDAAIDPLCAALGDPSDVVRQAVAVALKRLARPTSLECLRSRASIEPNAAVKQQIQRAIEAIEPARDTGGAQANNVRYYVALSRVVNHTSRSADEIEHVVHDAIVSKLNEMGGYLLAPAGESSSAAKGIIAKGRLKGYYLAISVDKFEYSGEGLRVRVKIAVFSYPGRDLRGEVPAGATLPGVTPDDRGSEDRLMAVVAAKAAELFAQNFQ